MNLSIKSRDIFSCTGICNIEHSSVWHCVVELQCTGSAALLWGRPKEESRDWRTGSGHQRLRGALPRVPSPLLAALLQATRTPDTAQTASCGTFTLGRNERMKEVYVWVRDYYGETIQGNCRTNYKGPVFKRDSGGRGKNEKDLEKDLSLGKERQ